MNTVRCLAGGIACLFLTAAHAAPAVSYFPQQGLGQFLADHFDIASIRSSLGPRRTAAQRTFTDVGLKPSKATDQALVFDSPGDWLYELTILGRRDVNGDGIEDLEVCFVDRARNGGTYHTSQGLVITRYSATGYAVALSFGLDNEACQDIQ